MFVYTEHFTCPENPAGRQRAGYGAARAAGKPGSPGIGATQPPQPPPRHPAHTGGHGQLLHKDASAVRGLAVLTPM